MLSATTAGTSVLFGKLGTPDTSLGSIFAFQVLAYHHLHLGFLCGALPHRGDADHHSWTGVGNAQDDAHLRRRKHERSRIHLHGADRGAADHPAISLQEPRAAN